MRTKHSQQLSKGATSAYAKEVCFMEVLYKQCCGIDIHKNMMVACLFTSVRIIDQEKIINRNIRTSKKSGVNVMIQLK